MTEPAGMKPYYEHNGITIYNADCRDVLPTLPAESVQCVVTSPPYWGLRDYGTAIWEGGNSDCNHMADIRFRDSSTIRDTTKEATIIEQGGKGTPFKNICGKCGAKRIDNQMGLETTPDEYIAGMVAVFREVRRVLKNDGVLFLNMGDSYIANSTGNPTAGTTLQGGKANQIECAKRPDKKSKILKPKDLCGIPWRLALALQTDGWWLRSDIIWAKPNPMPESVTDRPTKSHEYIFLFTKGQWKTRIVQLANLPSEIVHFNYNFRFQRPCSGAGAISIFLASSILDFAKFKYNFSLFSLDSKIGEQCSANSTSSFIGGLEIIHTAVIWSAKLLGSNCTTKDFLHQINSLGIALSDGNNLLIAGGLIEIPLSPTAYPNGKTSIRIHNSGEICEFDFVHNQIITHSPSSCQYYYDADAVREPQTDGSIQRWKSGGDRKAGDKALNRTGKPTNYTIQGMLENGRNLRDVWNIPTQPFPGAHFATFPEAIPERCIMAGTREGDTVLDPFSGAGTVGIVAKRLARRYCGIELKQEYIEMCTKRLGQEVLNFD